MSKFVVKEKTLNYSGNTYPAYVVQQVFLFGLIKITDEIVFLQKGDAEKRLKELTNE